MQPNKYFAIAALFVFGLTNWIVLSRSFSRRWSVAREKSDVAQDRTSPRLLVVMSLCAVLTMMSMGWVRESARAYNGYLIYGVMKLTDERPTYEPANDRQVVTGER